MAAVVVVMVFVVHERIAEVDAIGQEYYGAGISEPVLKALHSFGERLR